MRLRHYCDRHNTTGCANWLRFQKREKLGFIGFGNCTDYINKLWNLAIRVFGCYVMFKLKIILILLKKGKKILYFCQIDLFVFIITVYKFIHNFRKGFYVSEI